ncbi:MAG: sulfurtransferase TusA family protein [bacterium]|nr:sulfurtransferase TusA family protein [bacterium]
MRFFELPPQLGEDLKAFGQQVADFKSGTLSGVKFKGLRVAHGVYEQRQEGTFMIRLRCPGGALSPEQLVRAAEVSAQYGAPQMAVTTRGGLQLSFVDLENVMTVVHSLAEVGLSGRAGGGNTVRNMMAPHDAGVDPDEVFDVSPYLFELTTRMVAEPDSLNLPRKFKVAFSGKKSDPGKVKLTCLGFWAKEREGSQGFEVWVAGGTGSSVKPGHLLLDWIPEHRVYYVTKALKRMFDQHGNRRQRSKAKIKWLYEKLGKQEFERLFFYYYAMEQQEPGKELVLKPLENRAELSADLAAERPVDEHAFSLWRKRNVRHQKQAGLFQVRLPLRHGNLQNSDAKALGQLAAKFGQNSLRLSAEQNAYLRNIPEAHLGTLFNALQPLSSLFLRAEPELLGNMVTCTGAATCSLGMTQSRPALEAVQKALLASDLDLDALGDLKLYSSGCPNACGNNHVGDIGYFGKTGKVGQDIYPAYMIQIGSKLDAETIQVARRIASVPAKDLPAFTVDFLKGWNDKKAQWPVIRDYLNADEAVEDLLNLAASFTDAVPAASEDASYYTDWGDEQRFTLLKGRKAECSAGLFDMIEVDFETIEQATKLLEAGLRGSERKLHLYRLASSAAHSLLVTRGVEAFSDEEIFDAFSEHFIGAGLVPKLYQEPVDLAKVKDLDALDKWAGEVINLGEHMKKLYEAMDDSLRFNLEQLQGLDLVEEKEPETKAEAEAPTAQPESRADVYKDFRGVGCPMNFVKTKIALAAMPSGQTLEVLLDDGQPIINVPESVKLEGHEILAQDQTADGHWSVLILKA